ncbi:MAG TPA: hypothetical protein H9832_04065 [Candidatus Agathobaculum merdavium]|nr:hypothetical protein [Candidatus Agathobaculum merdavium]
MMETTSALFHRMRRRESGEAVLQEAWTAPTCARMLREEIERAGISAPEWIASAYISKSYGYQVLRGERMPGRDILLRTALVLQLSLQETQRLLALGDCGALYPKVRRDAAVIFALNHKMTLLEAEELLVSLPEASLFGQEKQT